MSYTLDIAIALGKKKTGLTLSAQLVDTSGANVGSSVTTGFTEIGSGFYLWHYTGFPDGHRGGVKFLASGSLVAFVSINPEQAERNRPYEIPGTVNDSAATAGSFTGSSNLSTTASFYVGCVLVFTSGVLQGIARKVTGYTSGRVLSFATAFPTAPANGDGFALIGRIE